MTATRDRYGEPLEEISTSTDTSFGDVHRPDCLEGWLPEDEDGRPVPCLHCRPHLSTKARGRRRPPVIGSDALSDTTTEKNHTGTARSPRETVSEKAQRLLATGRLHITAVAPDNARATCVGDTGTHTVTWDRAEGWSCTCPAYGARCSHISALRLVTVIQRTGTSA